MWDQILPFKYPFYELSDQIQQPAGKLSRRDPYGTTIFYYQTNRAIGIEQAYNIVKARGGTIT